MNIKHLATIAAISFATIGFTSCSKDKDNTATEQEYDARVKVKDGEKVYIPFVSAAGNAEGTIERKGNVYQLRNYRQGTMNAIGTAVVTANTNYYFDFKENDAANETNAAVTLPNSTRSANLQANTTAGYTLSYINKAFEAVTATDEFTVATEGRLGLESATVPGWLKYTGGPNHQVLAIENRTFILLKDGKPFFKFKVNSVYSNETMEKEVAPSNYFYYSIDYQEFK